MKKFLLLVMMTFSFGFVSAQYLVEDNDITENSKEFGRADISLDMNNPLEFYRLKCAIATYAQYIGGENGFKDKLFKNLKASLSNNLYSVNGTFDFIFYIDKEGNLKDFALKPEVPNSNLLQTDINNAVKAMNQKWMPATCDGAKVDSKIRLKVNFRTDLFDM